MQTGKVNRDDFKDLMRKEKAKAYKKIIKNPRKLLDKIPEVKHGTN
jgi:hypothetical protein